MKKKYAFLIGLMLNAFIGIKAQTIDFNHSNISFVGLDAFDSLTYRFYNNMYDSIKSKNDKEFIIRFNYSEMLLFKFKYGYENPNHMHILSSKENDAFTFAIEVVNKLKIDNAWVVGNDKIIYESDFRFINTVYPDLFSDDFILKVKEWRYNYSEILKLSSSDSVKIYSYLNNHVKDDWDCFVIKSALNRVTKVKLEADSIRIQLTNKKNIINTYAFYTGNDYLNSRISKNNLIVFLNTPFSSSFFDGYRHHKLVKNKVFKNCNDSYCKTIGVFDSKKFRKIKLSKTNDELIVPLHIQNLGVVYSKR